MSNFFPFEKIREEQGTLMNDVEKTIEKGKHLVADAPTGIGKTAAAVYPALKYALENKKTVFFITPKHS